MLYRKVGDEVQASFRAVAVRAAKEARRDRSRGRRDEEGCVAASKAMGVKTRRNAQFVRGGGSQEKFPNRYATCPTRESWVSCSNFSYSRRHGFPHISIELPAKVGISITRRAVCFPALTARTAEVAVSQLKIKTFEILFVHFHSCTVL